MGALAFAERQLAPFPARFKAAALDCIQFARDRHARDPRTPDHVLPEDIAYVVAHWKHTFAERAFGALGGWLLYSLFGYVATGGGFRDVTAEIAAGLHYLRREDFPTRLPTEQKLLEVRQALAEEAVRMVRPKG